MDTRSVLVLDLKKDYDFVVLEYDHKSSKAKEESFQKRRVVIRLHSAIQSTVDGWNI